MKPKFNKLTKWQKRINLVVKIVEKNVKNFKIDAYQILLIISKFFTNS